MKITFKPSEFNAKINSLIKKGYEEYYVCLEDGASRVTLTNTDPSSEYNGSVADVYEFGWAEFSGQFKGVLHPSI